jgi:hypothetical protein
MFHRLRVLLLRSRGAILFLCVSLARSGQGRPFSATWILHKLIFADGPRFISCSAWAN